MDTLLPSIYMSDEEINKTEFSRLLQKCLDAGIHINTEEISKYNPAEFASKFIHSLITKDDYNRKFIDNDAWENVYIFYRKYMSNPNTLLYVEINDIIPNFEIISNLIRKCNGLVFIPHIFEYGENSDRILNYILDNYKIDGIECYHSSFSEEQIQRLLKLCTDKDLLISGGSDYHGSRKEGLKMGVGFGNLNIPSNISIFKSEKLNFLK